MKTLWIRGEYKVRRKDRAQLTPPHEPPQWIEYQVMFRHAVVARHSTPGAAIRDAQRRCAEHYRSVSG